jgi:ribosome biogenesis GTPase / thiamine phosphate phosphatase
MRTSSDSSPLQEAVVVECFGRRAIVRLGDEANATRSPAAVFGKRTEVLCGDRVRVRIDDAKQGELQIIEVHARNSLLARCDSRGRTEHLAANLTLLVVVISAEPEPDPFIVDRYLAGAAYSHLKTLVIVNKCDVEATHMQEVLAEYQRAGYRTLAVSASTGQGLDELRTLLSGERLILVGQSGVGKSTLSNALIPASNRATRELSTSSGEGRHTTVSAALFEFTGGELIDSPGVRDYAPPPIADDSVQVGWPEILALAPQCRFNNCLHIREPGCAVMAAIGQSVSARRYESYKRLLNLMRQLLPSHERN